MRQEAFKFEMYERAVFDPLGGRELSDVEEFVAHLLLGGTAQQPVALREIRTRAELDLGRKLDERRVKAVIRALRRHHKLPILSSRRRPAGYWWCADVDEMRHFIKYWRGVALDELSTLAQIVRHNYPALAGQLSFVDLLEQTRNGNDSDEDDDGPPQPDGGLAD
jgi:hypothetical protein